MYLLTSYEVPPDLHVVLSDLHVVVLSDLHVVLVLSDLHVALLSDLHVVVLSEVGGEVPELGPHLPGHLSPQLRVLKDVGTRYRYANDLCVISVISITGINNIQLLALFSFQTWIRIPQGKLLLTRPGSALKLQAVSEPR